MLLSRNADLTAKYYSLFMAKSDIKNIIQGTSILFETFRFVLVNICKKKYLAEDQKIFTYTAQVTLNKMYKLGKDG